MNPNELMNVIKLSSGKEKFAILKALQSHKNGMRYNVLRKYLGIEDSSKFNYHCRILSKAKCIQRQSQELVYFITPRGEKIISILEDALSEKYIAEDVDQACRNSKDGNHVFIEVCRNCSVVKEDGK